MQIRNQSFPVLLCCTLVLAMGSAAQEQHPEHRWDYGESQGPSHWGELQPELPCARTAITNHLSTSAIQERLTCRPFSLITNLHRYTLSITDILS